MNVSVQTFSPPVMRSSLPISEDLVFEIFSRLPSKAIARCRCISKLLASMLVRQDFTESFLTKSCARPQLLFAFQYDSEVVFFSSPQPENPEENSYVVAPSQLACFPSSHRLFYTNTPTGGFFCYVVERIFEGMKDSEYVPVICNPSTGQSLNLPTLKSSKRFGVESYLGYDPVSKEFKVLSMETSFVSGQYISVKHQVLTLGTEKLSWRMVECCIPHNSSRKWICISGVLYYTARAGNWSSMVVCFDLNSEKFTFVNFMKASGKEMHGSTTLINNNGKLGLLMSEDTSSDYICGASKSLELWVLRDAGKNEWSEHVYVLPPSWEDVVSEYMRISGMVGTNEIVLAPLFQNVPPYVIYYNVERKTIRKVGIQVMEGLQVKRFYTFVNYVEDVKFL
ncbi:hypothetical protein Bca4012_033718 [Brassica carinata]|uniref:Uncharacterized protein n=2 Tax=Brassica TaxID=3705 RepID=A0A0D3C3L0_BRAOL|nr:PREDICTED: F-box protein DOR-like [Brassica oleracea var. oleracea]KAG2285813.1 hypothetical protein Bca52824_045417 [Brassica carinata]